MRRLHTSRQTRCHNRLNSATHLEGLNLPLFGAHLLPPCRLRLHDRLHARLKLVQLSPPGLHLLLHLAKLLGEPGLGFLTPLVEIQLDLAEGLETRNQVVMEHAEVREGFGFGLTVLLLVSGWIR